MYIYIYRPYAMLHVLRITFVICSGKCLGKNCVKGNGLHFYIFPADSCMDSQTEKTGHSPSLS